MTPKNVLDINELCSWKVNDIATRIGKTNQEYCLHTDDAKVETCYLENNFYQQFFYFAFMTCKECSFDYALLRITSLIICLNSLAYIKNDKVPNNLFQPMP